MRSISIAICCILLVAGAAFAQSDRGTITGTIADPAGAVIPGASIEAKNINTGATYTAASSATGNYTIGQLPAGKYQLSASVPGFKQFLRTGITVLVAQTLRIDIPLEVGDIAETVTVNADAPLLKTESGELSHNISTNTLDSLPILGFTPVIRDPYATAILIPGAAYRNRGYVRINGAPNNSQSIRVDGQDAANGVLLNSTALNQQSVEAVEEVAIQTSNYAAEYGQSGGGFFNLTMKSGTNAFHGSVYDYISNEFFNANDPFINTKDDVRRHNYGFTAGGPVYLPKIYDGHEKTFFFFNLEQYRETSYYNTSYQTVPTLAYREGNFQQVLQPTASSTPYLITTLFPGTADEMKIYEGTIYDPNAEHDVVYNGRTYTVRDPFTDNTIPSDRFDPVAKKIQDLIPLPKGDRADELTTNYLDPWSSVNHRTVPSFKIDHNLSSRSKLSFFWSYTKTWNPNSVFFSDGMLSSPVTWTRNTDVRAGTARLNFDHTLAPTKLLHLGVGTQTMKFGDANPYKGFDQLKELGLPGANADFFPYMSGLYTSSRGGKGSTTQGMGPNVQSLTRMLKTTANASFTWVQSNHTYKFGGEMRLEGYPATIWNPAYGYYRFSAEQTGLPIEDLNLRGRFIGFPYASFLLGLINSGDIGVASNPKLGKSAWGLYAQDSWKATRKLTLDYGLRWDWQGYLSEMHGRASNFSPTTANPTAGGLLGAVIFEGSGPGHCNCDFAKVYPYAFGPRLGVAYQITPKTVIRAGAGITYAQTASENRTSSSFASSYPYVRPAYGYEARQLKDGPPPPTSGSYVWPNLDPGQYPFMGIPAAVPIAIDQNAGRPGRQIQWSFGIQRELTRNLSIEASYIGNRGAWWEANQLINVNALSAERLAEFGLDLNVAANRTLLATTLESATGTNPVTHLPWSTPPYTDFPTTLTVAQSLRPYPQFTNITYRWAPLGRTWYDGLQIKVTKRFSHGLDFTSAFTWQKELMMGAADAISTGLAPVNDVFNRAGNKYISRYSRPFVWITSVNYTVPKLGINRALSWAIRDWTLGIVYEEASGMPIQVPAASSNSVIYNYTFQSTFAERVPGQPLWLRTYKDASGNTKTGPVDINDMSSFDARTDFVLNPAAWKDPDAGKFSNSPAYYSDYRAMRRPMQSLSIGRIFRLKEGVTFSVRADFQNIFNRLVLNDPSSTSFGTTQRWNDLGDTQAGFGDINTTALASQIDPRNGIIVARIQF